MKGSTEYQTQLAHLVKLASSPGWREYVKGRLDELEAESFFPLNGEGGLSGEFNELGRFDDIP